MSNDFDGLSGYFSKHLLGKLIYNTDEGVYILYEKYQITKNKNTCVVERFTDGSLFVFSKLRIAATWAILDRYNKIVEAKRVIDLDSKIASLQVEADIHKKLQNKGSLESREISRDKYLAGIAKQKQFQWELDKYIILAKKCQDKGYENELTRTSRK